MSSYNFDMNVHDIISEAVEMAKISGGEVRPEHLLYGMVSFVSSIQIELKQYGITPFKVNSYLQFSPRTESYKTSKLSIEVLETAKKLSETYYTGQINVYYLYLGLLDVYSTATLIFQDSKFNPRKRYNEIMSTIGGATKPDDDNKSQIEVQKSVSSVSTAEKVFDEKKYYNEESVIIKLTTDLTAKAEKGLLDPVIGREKEIERIVQILSRRTKNNPVLIGEPGVGKTAVVEGLANAIAEGLAPSLANKRILMLDVSSLVSGTKYRGEFEERLQTIVKEVKEHGNIILFIDEIHNLVNAGATEGGSLDAGNILKPMLARGELQTIGATTLDEYRKYFEKDQALERRFQPVTVEPPTVEDTIVILNGLKSKYESFHGITITDDAIRSAAVLSDKYIQDRFLPDKAIDLIDEAGSRCRISGKGDSIDSDSIAEIVSDWTGIPVSKLTKEETNKLNNLEEILTKRVIGQPEAVKKVALAIKRARVGLKDSNKPIGSFIFLGQSGVGKTELAKAIAEALFGDEDKLIRFDMSEYKDKSSINRLTGSAPGYVGFEEGGQLTEKVRRKPYSVLLFDEIEKADPDVFNIFLQIMDDGRLTDGHGKTVSFKNCVIIMTSNLGAEAVSKNVNLGFGASNFRANSESKHIEALKKAMKPEFINRLDEIVVFNPLSHADLAKIFDLLLLKLAKKLFEKNIKIKISRQAKDFIVKKGTSFEYGARPLKRTLRDLVEDKLSELILSDRLNAGDTVWIDLSLDELTFDIK